VERSPGRSSFSAGPVLHGGPTLEQPVLEGLNPMERNHAGAVLEGLQPEGSAHAGAGEKYEEAVAERSCHGLTTTPIPHPPALLGGRGRGGLGNEEVKLSLGRRGRIRGEGVFSFVFVFHHPTLFWF